MILRATAAPVALAMFAVVAPITAALAHHPGGAGNAVSAGPIVTIPGITLSHGQLVVGTVTEYIGFSRVSDARLLDGAAEGRHVHSIRSILSSSAGFAYGVSDDLTLALRLPFVRRTGIREGHLEDPADPPEIHEHGTSSGFGDVTLLAQWRFLKDVRGGTDVAALIGLKAPTGVTDRKDREGERLDTEFQPGSGSLDGLLGLALSQSLGGALSFHSNVLYALVGDGAQDTNLGDRVNYNFALAYRLSGLAGASPGYDTPMKAGVHRGAHSHGPKAAPHTHEPGVSAGPRLDVVLEWNGEWHDRQTERGVRDPDSGGHVAYISPGLRFSMDNWSSFVSVGVPVVKDLNGTQSEPEIRILSGVGIAF